MDGPGAPQQISDTLLIPPRELINPFQAEGSPGWATFTVDNIRATSQPLSIIPHLLFSLISALSS